MSDLAETIHVDITMCIGAAVCEDVATGIFEVDEDDGISRVIGTEQGPEDRARVDAAITQCPIRAIKRIPSASPEGRSR